MSHPFSCTLHDVLRFVHFLGAACILPDSLSPTTWSTSPLSQTEWKWNHGTISNIHEMLQSFSSLKKSFRHCFYVHLHKQSVHYSNWNFTALRIPTPEFYLQYSSVPNCCGHKRLSETNNFRAKSGIWIWKEREWKCWWPIEPLRYFTTCHPALGHFPRE